MVINNNQHFLDIFKPISEDTVLNLPTYKENGIQINFTTSQESIYQCQEPLLPFAASEVFHAAISKWRRLTALDESCKAVYEISFDIEGSNFNFRPGDTIGILPQNSQPEIDSLIELLNLNNIMDVSYTISIDNKKKGAKIPTHLPVKSTLSHVLTHIIDLRGVLKKLFLLALSRHTKDRNEKRILEYLCSKEGSMAYTTHILNKHMSLIDILTTFKTCKPPIEVILANLPRLLPRPYSIVNSHSNDPDLIKICFSTINIGNSKKGITTGMLEKIILAQDDVECKMKNLNLNNNVHKIPIYLRKNMNEFCLPLNFETPTILIGPGTGVSPFIGFLEEREHFCKTNPDTNLGYAWLFFGCRYPKLDYIYEEELNYFVSNGVLDKLTTSFSRCSNTETKYVQDAVIQNSEEIAKLIMQGAHVYVCGDIQKMATPVREAIVHCIAKHGDKTSEEADQFVSNMVKEKKYLNDVWN